MNYPKIGDAYKLTQILDFVTEVPNEDGGTQVSLLEREVVHFFAIDTHSPTVRDAESHGSLICRLTDRRHRKFVVTYKILTELVRSGALVSFIKGDINKNLNLEVERIGLSARALNVVRQMPDVVTVKDLVSKTEADLLKVKQCGPKALGQIKAILSELGLSLASNR